MGAVALQQGLFPAASSSIEQIQGTVESVIFESPAGSFRIIRIRGAGKEEMVLKGPGPKVGPGQEVRAHGVWETDKRFGRQFKADWFELVPPTTTSGIALYLQGLVAGVGPVMATNVAEALGTTALEKIAADPTCLRGIRGLSEQRADALATAVREDLCTGQAVAFLHSVGLAEGMARRVLTAWGVRAVERIQSNPYSLMEIDGIGFIMADQIAKGLGLDPAAPARVRSGISHILREASRDGHVFLPGDDLLSDVSRLLDGNVSILEIRDHVLAMNHEDLELELDGEGHVDRVYLRWLYEAETRCASRLARLIQEPGVSATGSNQADAEIADVEFDLGIELAERQREAVLRAVRDKVLVITGGPGVGKTLIVRAITRILNRSGKDFLLAAPTGKAARRLEEATGRPAATIHRMLEYFPPENRFTRDADNPLDADWIILDEASMIDVDLFHHVLDAIRPKAHLVLVGDVDQLPSVGPGVVLCDLIESGVVPVVRLDTIFRQAADSGIIVNAHRVNRGEQPWLPDETWPDFFVIDREKPEDAQALIVDLVTNRIPVKFNLNPVTDIQVLTPMHKGALGTKELNQMLREKLNPKGAPITQHVRSLRVGDRVMQTTNNYDLGVMNGEVGLIQQATTEGGATVLFDARQISYARDMLGGLELAYAFSIHKSQGMEFPCVVIAMHSQHYVMLRRNLLYTGITRGKRLVILVGRAKSIAQAARTEDARHRNSRLADRLRAELGAA